MKNSRYTYEALKRSIDVLGAIFGLLVLSPLLATAALAIVVDTRGPALFRQVRAGRGGKPFVIYKFRTMRTDHTVVDRALDESDPSITRVGRFLRATSIDELPQLINVVLGDMSLVGPRPTIPEQAERYNAFQARRLEVRPGLTGWAQVNGRNTLSWDRRIELDVWYVDNRSVALDATILARTVGVVAKPDLTWGRSDGEELSAK